MASLFELRLRQRCSQSDRSILTRSVYAEAIVSAEWPFKLKFFKHYLYLTGVSTDRTSVARGVAGTKRGDGKTHRQGGPRSIWPGLSRLSRALRRNIGRKIVPKIDCDD